jgi:hypothetical protein
LIGYSPPSIGLHSSFQGEGNIALFEGSYNESKETDCILIFDGQSFRLERVTTQAMGLRYTKKTLTDKRKPLSEANSQLTLANTSTPSTASPPPPPPTSTSELTQKVKIKVPTQGIHISSCYDSSPFIYIYIAFTFLLFLFSALSKDDTLPSSSPSEERGQFHVQQQEQHDEQTDSQEMQDAFDIDQYAKQIESELESHRTENDNQQKENKSPVSYPQTSQQSGGGGGGGGNDTQRQPSSQPFRVENAAPNKPPSASDDSSNSDSEDSSSSSSDSDSDI